MVLKCLQWKNLPHEYSRPVMTSYYPYETCMFNPPVSLSSVLALQRVWRPGVEREPRAWLICPFPTTQIEILFILTICGNDSTHDPKLTDTSPLPHVWLREGPTDFSGEVTQYIGIWTLLKQDDIICMKGVQSSIKKKNPKKISSDICRPHLTVFAKQLEILVTPTAFDFKMGDTPDNPKIQTIPNQN